MNILGVFCKSAELKRRITERRSRLYRVAFSWTHDAALADDLTQDAIIKALRNSAQLRDARALDKWLFGILTNCWRDHFRRQRPTEDLDNMVLVDNITPEDNHAQQHIVKHVRAAISQLPEGQRQAVTLVDLEGFSYAEVADILGIPIGTVMSRLCRARKRLALDLLEINPQAEDTSPRLRRVK